jgi:uncharacterized metal-binding protein YceD (DUF177 family)
MSQAELVVPVADLERGPKHVTFALSEPWLRRALEGTDASSNGPGEADVTLSKNGTEILVRGTLQARLTMPCVITLDPVPVVVQTDVLLLLAPRTAAPGHHEADAGGRSSGRARGRTRDSAKGEAPEAPGERRGRAKSLGVVEGGQAPGKKEGRWEETPVLSDEDAGRDTYEGHEVVLDGLLRELLILELPMFPRRSDLPTDAPGANPPLPAETRPEGPPPLDPRFSKLAELKSRLEKTKKE